MNECDNTRQMLVLYGEGELEPQQAAGVWEHLAACPRCRQEAEETGQIRRWLMDPGLFEPEETYAWQLLPRTISERAGTSGPVRSWLPVNFGTSGWALSMAASLMLAVGAVWFVNRPAPEPVSASAFAAPDNPAFLRRIQAAYALEATNEYLNECQDLLLTLMRAQKKCPGADYDVSLEVERARSLLRRKQLLDSELKSPEVARAKSLCDELENFLVHLSTSERCETPGGMRKMENYIRKEQLLLRISLLQSELS